jgi:hypothetical protein
MPRRGDGSARETSDGTTLTRSDGRPTVRGLADPVAIGNYRILRRIGEGGMGVVRHNAIGRPDANLRGSG